METKDDPELPNVFGDERDCVLAWWRVSTVSRRTVLIEGVVIDLYDKAGRFFAVVTKDTPIRELREIIKCWNLGLAIGRRDALEEQDNP